MEVRVPFHRIAVCGNIVFAAQGGHIHSYNSSLTYISTWRHPGTGAGDAAAPEEAGETNELANDLDDLPENEVHDHAPATEEPPAKRRKVEDSRSTETEEAREPQNDENGDSKQPSTGKGKKKGKGAKARPVDKPYVQSFHVTSDGRFVVVDTGSDKTIWVFEHDGQGRLKELSRRVMPKRPCSIVVTPDDETILIADKFGDVFALPLFPKETETSPGPVLEVQKDGEAAPSPSDPPESATLVPFKPQANEFTVHSKRNLRALKDQRKAMKKTPEKPAAAMFDRTLLLGHVSMLTAIVYVIEPKTGRPHIITADRDEHIRISRGVLSQAHIIEGFCFGHEEFVSCLCSPPGNPELLISGGGDDDLFLWDWHAGLLLGRADVLSHAKQVCGEVEQISVSRIHAQRVGDMNWVCVMCESIPALFLFTLTAECSLKHAQTIHLERNPLDIAAGTETGSFLVSVDPNQWPREEGADDSVDASQPKQDGPGVTPLLSIKNVNGSLWEMTKMHFSAGEGPAFAEANNRHVRSEELQRMLYGIEMLRKTGKDSDE